MRSNSLACLLQARRDLILLFLNLLRSLPVPHTQHRSQQRASIANMMQQYLNLVHTSSQKPVMTPVCKPLSHWQNDQPTLCVSMCHMHAFETRWRLTDFASAASFFLAFASLSAASAAARASFAAFSAFFCSGTPQQKHQNALYIMQHPKPASQISQPPQISDSNRSDRAPNHMLCV
jgi:hypothetical protein